MAGVPRLSKEELDKRDKKQRQYRKEYYSRPDIKQRQKLYYKKKNKDPISKRLHAEAQERYRHTVKGMATTARYWNKRGLRMKGIDTDTDKKEGKTNHILLDLPKEPRDSIDLSSM